MFAIVEGISGEEGNQPNCSFWRASMKFSGFVGNTISKVFRDDGIQISQRVNPQ
jgi:hypothetical protein